MSRLPDMGIDHSDGSDIELVTRAEEEDLIDLCDTDSESELDQDDEEQQMKLAIRMSMKTFRKEEELGAKRDDDFPNPAIFTKNKFTASFEKAITDSVNAMRKMKKEDPRLVKDMEKRELQKRFTSAAEKTNRLRAEFVKTLGSIPSTSTGAASLSMMRSTAKLEESIGRKDGQASAGKRSRGGDAMPRYSKKPKKNVSASGKNSAKSVPAYAPLYSSADEEEDSQPSSANDRFKMYPCPLKCGKSTLIEGKVCNDCKYKE